MCVFVLCEENKQLEQTQKLREVNTTLWGSLPIFNHIMLIRKLLRHFVENVTVVMYIYKRRSQHSLARNSPFQWYSQVCSKFGPYCLLLFEGSLERSKQFKLLNRPHCIAARLTFDILITAPRTELRDNLTEGVLQSSWLPYSADSYDLDLSVE